MHNLPFYGLLATLVWLPLAFGSNQPMFWFYGQLALQVCTVGTLLMLASGHFIIPPLMRKAVLPVGIFLFFLLSQIFVYVSGLQAGADRHATYGQLLKTLCLFEVFCLTLLLVNTEPRFKLLVVVLLISGTFQAVYGTLMTVTGTDYIWYHRKETYIGVATGTFVNRNHLAGYLEMTLALGLGLLISGMSQTRSRTWRQFLRGWTDTLLGEKARIRICLVLMVIGLILTRSRMGNTAFFVGMGIAGLMGFFVFRKSQSGVVALFVSIIIIDILLLGTFFGIEELQQRFEQTDLDEEQRVDAVILSLGLIPLAPWLGHGLGAFYTVFPWVRSGEISKYYNHAHSDLVEFPVELGLLGTLPLLLLFLLSLGLSIRVQFKRNHPFFKAMGFSVTMALISIAIHSSTDFNLQIFANAATFVCILAMPWLAMHLPRETAGHREFSNGVRVSGSGEPGQEEAAILHCIEDTQPRVDDELSVSR